MTEARPTNQLRTAAKLALRIADEDEWNNSTLYDALKACDVARQVISAAMHQRHQTKRAFVKQHSPSSVFEFPSPSKKPKGQVENTQSIQPQNIPIYNFTIYNRVMRHYLSLCTSLVPGGSRPAHFCRIELSCSNRLRSSAFGVA